MSKRMSTDQVRALYGLYSAVESIKNSYEPLKDRMIEDPYALRGLKSSEKHINRATETIMNTLDQNEKSYIYKNAKGHEVIVRPKHIVKDDVWMYVNTNHLNRLIELAQEKECSLCVKDRQDQGACTFRKVLIELVGEPASKFGCGFKGVIK